MRANGLSDTAQQEIRQTVIPNITQERTIQGALDTRTSGIERTEKDKDIIILPADKAE